MNNESQNLHRYLNEIASRSFAGSIPWNQPNPSTFQWVKDSEGESFTIIIQKASNPKSRQTASLLSRIEEHTYLFQVQNRRSRQTVMSLSSADRPEFNKVLATIFEGAEKGIDVRSSQVLRKLLNNE